MLKIKHKKLSIKRECKLLSLNRSGVYYKEANNFDADEVLMQKIDKIHTNYPFYGYRHIRAILKRKGYPVNSKRVFHLMKQIVLCPFFLNPTC